MSKSSKNVYSKKTGAVSSKYKPSTPYCATCHNAGEDVSVYTNHFTKSSPGPEGVVICPLILSSTCGYCRKIGHWTKFCPILLSRQNTCYDEAGSVLSSVNDSDDDCTVTSIVSTASNLSKSDLLKKAIHVAGEGLNTYASVVSSSMLKRVIVPSTPIQIPKINSVNAPIKPIYHGDLNFTPVTPDSTPPKLTQRRLWADMEDDDE